MAGRRPPRSWVPAVPSPGSSWAGARRAPRGPAPQTAPTRAPGKPWPGVAEFRWQLLRVAPGFGLRSLAVAWERGGSCVNLGFGAG